MVPTAPLCSKRNLTVKYTCVKIYFDKRKSLLRTSNKLRDKWFDQYSLRYRVSGNSVNTKPVSGSLVNRKSFSGSSIISKVFGGNPVNCRTYFDF
jgi:hypothetical protein